MVPAATTIKGELIYWINSETEEVWRRFVNELIYDKTYGTKLYMYIDAKIIQDTPNYFVFSAVMWENADAHRDGKDPIYMDYYRVNKADAKSEKININAYKDLAGKLV